MNPIYENSEFVKKTKATQNLKRKSKKVKVSKSNQEIINKSSIVFISLLPKIAIKELARLKFNKNHKIVLHTPNQELYPPLCQLNQILLNVLALPIHQRNSTL